jgi:hydroxymethylpyrimidine pyrophosphatase-like HAD family hydrolase
MAGNPLRENAIDLVVVDNEGCFIPAKGRPIPTAPIERLRSFLHVHTEIHLTFCTGRSVPYMEAMVQLAGLVESPIPVICEGGAVVYWPARDRWEVITSAVADREILGALPPNSYRLEPGKIVCVSVYPEPPQTVASILSLLATSANAAHFSITPSVAAVDITPHGIDKGFGLRRLVEITHIPLANILCIGDATNDLPMMSIAGYAACPANANQEVKDLASYVSPRSHTDGVLDILHYFFGGNEM